MTLLVFLPLSNVYLSRRIVGKTLNCREGCRGKVVERRSDLSYSNNKIRRSIPGTSSGI